MAYRVTVNGSGYVQGWNPPSESAFIAELNQRGWDVQSFTLRNVGWGISLSYTWTLVYISQNNPSQDGAVLRSYFDYYFMNVSLETTNIQEIGGGTQQVTQQEPGIFQSMQSLFGQNYLGGSGASGNTYTVVRGDTFNRIAARFNLTPDQLANVNPQVTNRDVLNVGQILNISRELTPGGGQPTPSAPGSGGGQPTPSAPDNRNWFDKTFFTGAGALTGTAIGVLVVLGAVVVTQVKK